MRGIHRQLVHRRDNVTDLAGTLANVPLFEGLDRKTIRQLAEHAKPRTYAPGERIVTEDAPASAFYVILRGKVKVERGHDNPLQWIGELGPGDFFGEMALLEEHPRTATVTAVDETDCVLFVAWEFTAMLKEYPRIALPILMEILGRIHRREHHLEAQS
jgi:CRP-like cAMP-binding protein